MDRFGDIIETGFHGETVEIDHDDVGFWAFAGNKLLAGPFHSDTNARQWLANPTFRETHPTDRFGIDLWCVHVTQG
jgi:hypothetical protein